jgi:hypothetical protein
VRILDVLGGPDYEVSYPNGDRTAYITTVYEARIIGGSPAPGDGELSEIAWFTPAELPGLQLSRFTPSSRTIHPGPDETPSGPARTAVKSQPPHDRASPRM